MKYQLPDQTDYDELHRRVQALPPDSRVEFWEAWLQLGDALMLFGRDLSAAVAPLLADLDAILNAPWYVKVWWRLRDLLKAKEGK